ncbi:putative Kcna5-prov protein [Paratrimastix pyriformis]|uniref:Kcna5-prov protein n=1 Tax=Paratrimastix pyriformis TaxID=342808 RepID=A0ABQ8UX77_9EUKA|nr:putative Kcna5-prov protein [Paratrimastix pyriformis]
MLQAVTTTMMLKKAMDENGDPVSRMIRQPSTTHTHLSRKPTLMEALFSDEFSFTQVQAILFVLFDSQATPVSRLIHWSVMALILISSGAFVVETIPALYVLELPIWFMIESFCMVVFTVEYGARLVAHWQTWKAFVFAPLNIIDLISIGPFYVELLISAFVSEKFMDARVVRIIRLARVFRLFKLGRYSRALRNVARAFRKSMHALALLVFFLIIALILFSSAEYYIERGTWDAQAMKWIGPDGSESPFQSIPQGFWWAITTLTTVGYGTARHHSRPVLIPGDVVPHTDTGRFLGAMVMLCGVLVVAMPSGIIATEFTKQYDEPAASAPPAGTTVPTSTYTPSDLASMRSGSPVPTEFTTGSFSPPLSPHEGPAAPVHNLSGTTFVRGAGVPPPLDLSNSQSQSHFELPRFSSPLTASQPQLPAVLQQTGCFQTITLGDECPTGELTTPQLEQHVASLKAVLKIFEIQLAARHRSESSAHSLPDTPVA